MSICASIYTPRIICPPDKRTFNSDGTRVSEVGLKEWEEGGKKEGEGGGRGVGGKSVMGSMHNPTYGFGEGEKSTGVGSGSGDDDGAASLSGETLNGEREKGGERRGSFMKRLFHRRGSEDKAGKDQE